MGVLLANHCDTFNKKIALSLIELDVPIVAIVSDQIAWFSNKSVPSTTKIYDVYDFYFRDRIEQLLPAGTQPLNKDTIQTYADTEATFLRVSDRLAYAPIHVHDRVYLFHCLLKFWIRFFEKNNVTVVMFAQTPHTGYDNVLYDVAKKRGVPIVLVNPTVITDRVMLRADYMQRSIVPAQFKKLATKKQLVAEIDQDLLAAVHSVGSWGALGQNINTTVLTNMRGNVVSRFVRRVSSQFLRSPVSSVQALVKRTRNSGFVYLPARTVLAEHIASVLQYPAKKRLAALYASLCAPSILTGKYVYFSLHYQPERTTLPEGGIFENQLLAIEIVANALPKGWKLLVKEHPRQFSFNDVRTTAFRTELYYRYIAAIPSVQLVSMNVPSQKLIEHAQCTVSVQGTASWESLLHGKPSIIFAPAWYAACRSCFMVDSVTSCQQAFRNIKEKTRKTVELDLLKFLLYTQDEFITSAFLEQPARMSSKPYTVLVANLAQALKKHYETIIASSN